MKIIRPLAITDAVLQSSNVSENDFPAYSASTVYATGTKVLYVATNTHLVYESLTGSSAAITMTIASPCVVTWTAHGQAAGTPISFATTGALPTGVVAGTVYYVLAPTANTFNIAATVGGAAIVTSGSQSGVQTATASNNYNIPVTDATKWLSDGADNRWKCFDVSITSQTSNTTSIANVFATTGRIDSVALLNINAASVTITQTDATDGVVYDKTTSLVADSGIQDWFAYLFEPIIRVTDSVATDLLPYANSTISVTLTDTGNTVLCGGMVLGLSKDISYKVNNSPTGIAASAKVGIQDYSIKQRDTFGNYTILQRAFNKKADFTVYIENSAVDSVVNLLSDYRATPTVYVGSSSFGSTIIYGFYKDFSVDIAYPTKSVCTISLEGLT